MISHYIDINDMEKHNVSFMSTWDVVTIKFYQYYCVEAEVY